MKLRNKKTGEIVEFRYLQSDYVAALVLKTYENDKTEMYRYNSLAELNAEWEDYEGPKKYWFIDAFGNIVQNEITKHYGDEYTDMTNAYENQKQIGNYFETKEEAEKAVKKLKAWKRLKDKGFEFAGWTIDDGLRISICSNIDEEDIYDEDKRKMKPDLDLLFGGEE